MSLLNWHKNGWLRPHQTNRQQIADLLAIVDRDLAGQTTAEEAAELIDFCAELKADVLGWLRQHHAGLLDPKSET